MSENLRIQLEFLPEYLGRHLVLTLLALGIGIMISIPLGMVAARRPRLRTVILGTSSIVLTIPGLALLALMVPLLGIGFLPALIALTLYSTLPIIRNTVTGLTGVEPAVIEAARGMGMTPRQILFRVRFPLALPIIIAGIRTASVWTVSIATLATPVGATSLGNYIFSGLTTQNYTALMFGCVIAAVLALLLDSLIHLLEISVAQQRVLLGAAASVVLVAIFAGGLLPMAYQDRLADRRREDGRAAQRLVIGTKSFTEQYILADLMADLLAEGGYDAEIRRNLGSTVLFDATARGDVAAYVDYSGTIWANHMNRTTNPGKEAITREVTAWLAANPGIAVLGSLGFENRYTLAMRRAAAERRGIESIEDLARVSEDLVIASDYEFFSRPEWITLRDTYGIEFGEKKSFDPALMYQAVDRGEVDVITAYSTDGRIPAYDLVVLDDPRGAFLTYEALLLLSPQTANRGGVREALKPLLGALDMQSMQAANRIVDVEGRPVQAAVDILRRELAGRRDAGATP